ncbi:MAG: SGNH/GDSL hydrolase family protein [Muribaculaceae bacterium]|nr:SGNH/GDSL hydrolase family protein [Muribaculaceae bacterium]MDE6533144.1 SGNH/GDSL hydrolase family protein [Muribaculaceae bacterium]MDE6772303.1 SGNH/GDSL hydrolase family protein [Muribaculaceae bacterium]
MKRLFLFMAAFLMLLPLAAQSRKSVSVLGDSYSTFEGFVEPATNELWYYARPKQKQTDVNDVKQTWWHLFIKENGYRLEKNNSYSGSTVSTTGYQGNDYTARSFITRMDNLGSPDMIIIFGATNDSWAGSPLGEFDWSGNSQGDFKSFRPALCYMLSHLKDRHPNTEIIYLINDGLKESITSSIVEACTHYGIPYVQLHDIDKTAGHPNVNGMRQIADQLTKALK